jgi:hypothetical protein
VRCLFAGTLAARAAPEQQGIVALADRGLLVQRLREDLPGQSGKICRTMAVAGINIRVICSDHQDQLVPGVNDIATG